MIFINWVSEKKSSSDNRTSPALWQLFKMHSLILNKLMFKAQGRFENKLAQTIITIRLEKKLDQTGKEKKRNTQCGDEHDAGNLDR